MCRRVALPARWLCSLLLAAAGLASACSPADPDQEARGGPPAPGEPPPTLTVDGNGVDALRIGDRAGAISKRFDVVADEMVAGEEGLDDRILTVDLGVETVSIVLDDGRAWRIEIDSPALRTADDIGVGTPLSRFLDIDGVEAVEGHGRLYLISPDHCGLSFRLDLQLTAEDYRDHWKRDTLAGLREDTEVDRVLVVGC